jgi:hypothetical protein
MFLCRPKRTDALRVKVTPQPADMLTQVMERFNAWRMAAAKAIGVPSAHKAVS